MALVLKLKLLGVEKPQRKNLEVGRKRHKMRLGGMLLKPYQNVQTTFINVVSSDCYKDAEVVLRSQQIIINSA